MLTRRLTHTPFASQIFFESVICIDRINTRIRLHFKETRVQPNCHFTHRCPLNTKCKFQYKSEARACPITGRPQINKQSIFTSGNVCCGKRAIHPLRPKFKITLRIAIRSLDVDLSIWCMWLWSEFKQYAVTFVSLRIEKVHRNIGSIFSEQSAENK